MMRPVRAMGPQMAAAAEYRACSGSLPPEQAWDVNVTFRDDVSAALRHCRGTPPRGRAARCGRAG